MSNSGELDCPVCEFSGPLALVRAHVTVEADSGDQPHADWLADHGIDLTDDEHPSQGKITRLLRRGDS